MITQVTITGSVIATGPMWKSAVVSSGEWFIAVLRSATPVKGRATRNAEAATQQSGEAQPGEQDQHGDRHGDPPQLQGNGLAG